MKKKATIVRKSPCTVQTDETKRFRVFCYFNSSPLRNFELFKEIL